MGGKSSHHHVVYYTPPAAAQSIQQAETKLADLNNPATFAQREQDLFQSYLAGLQELTFQEVIPKSAAGENHHIFTGNISVGKTSLLNNLFQLTLPTGYGHTTTSASAVVKDPNAKMVVWDCPGNNTDFNYLDPDQLNLFKSANLVFVLVGNSVLTCDKIIKTIAQIKGNQCVILLTKCDTIDASHHRTLDEEIQDVKNTLTSWGLPHLRVYATSAQGGFQNDSVLSVMKQAA